MHTIIALLSGLLLSACSAFSMSFVHPGAIDSLEELNYVKTKLAEGAQPWSSEFERLAKSTLATREPHGLVHLNAQNEDARISQADASAAYTQALLWYYSGEETYAKRAIAILEAWTGLEAFTSGSDQDRLQAAWLGATFAPAAEIMRLHPAWSKEEQAKLQAMFKKAFYPQLNTASTWNGNVDLTQIDAMLSIAVFNEDEAEFLLGLSRLKIRVPAYFYLRSDGPTPQAIAGDWGDTNKFWFHPTEWVDGLMQESCRDNGHHVQFALGSALHAAETAWHQGIDLYTENQERFAAAMELLATQLLKGSMQGLSSTDEVTPNRFDTWEIGYNHYHTRAGLALPMTRRLLLEQIRPHAERASCNLHYETLTHAELPNQVAPGKAKHKELGLRP